MIDVTESNLILPWKKTEKQVLACKILAANRNIMLYGGSRSGKTFIIIYALVLRALSCQSRHLVVRFRFNHVKRSIWFDTFPKVMKICFPDVKYRSNKMDWYVELPINGSQIWFGGIDDKERTEQILGNEYSTVYANECSQISYEAIVMLMTRLAQKTNLTNKMFFDCNPPSKKHWTHALFEEHIDPVDRTPIDTEGQGTLLMNPVDNKENIAQGYIENVLMKMPARQRHRFLQGMYLSDIEGALWSIDMITQARAKESAELKEVVVGCDPSASSGPNSDLCGIVVCGKDINGEGVVIADHSLRASPNVWATQTVKAYHHHDASCIVAEVNQGGDMVEQIIHSVDPKVKIIKVYAKRGKIARAEPISALYEQGKIAHMEGLDDLETEMMEFVPLTSMKSPDRMDACVYALSHLLLIQRQHEPSVRIA